MKFLKLTALYTLLDLGELYWYILLFLFMVLTLPYRLLAQAHRDKFDWLARADFEDAARRTNPLE